MEMSTGKDKLLRNALKANSIFSAISGFIFIVGSSYISEAIGLNKPVILMIIGISLMIFSFGLYQLANKQKIYKPAVWTIIGSDLAWVMASAVLIFMFPNLLNEEGRLLVIMIALVVFSLAELQAWGQLQVNRSINTGK